MKNTFNYQFYCRPCRLNKQGTAPIELSVTINKKRALIQLPYRTTPAEFAKKRRSTDIERYLDTQRVQINKIVTEVAAHGEPLTTTTFRTYFINGGYRAYTIENLVKDFLSIQKKRGISQQLFHKYEFVAGLLYEEVEKDNDCSAITNSVVRSFVAKIERKYENSTAISYYTKLKAFIRYAQDNGHIKISPIQGVKIAKITKDIDYLTEEEIERLKAVKPQTECMEKIKACALFQISSGLSYCDCLDLKPEDLQEKDGTHFISKKRHKTGTPFVAVVLPFGAEIFKRYNGKLPLCSNQKYNLFLKALAEQAKIDKNLHTHIFRHTYCTLLLNRGVSIKTISRCAGHTTSAMTEKFYAHLKEETIIEEVAKIL